MAHRTGTKACPDNYRDIERAFQGKASCSITQQIITTLSGIDVQQTRSALKSNILG